MHDFEGKRLLVLGCGYLGRFLVSDALASGMRVLAVSRNLDTLRGIEKMGAEVYCGMVDEDAWHEAAGGDVDYVVNCVSSAGGGLAGYRQSYLGGNESLIAWARDVAFSGGAIYTSSVSACGDAEGGWVDEKNCPAPGHERGAIVAESEALFLREMGGGSRAVLRLAGLYGPGRHMLMNRLKGGATDLAGRGDYYLNLIRIEDVAAAVWASFGAGVSGLFNVVDDEPCLKEDMVKWLARRMGVAVPVFTGAADTSGRSSRRLGEGGPPANRRIRNAALKAATGWQPRFGSFREGFGELLDAGDRG